MDLAESGVSSKCGVRAGRRAGEAVEWSPSVPACGTGRWAASRPSVWRVSMPSRVSSWGPPGGSAPIGNGASKRPWFPAAQSRRRGSPDSRRWPQRTWWKPPDPGLQAGFLLKVRQMRSTSFRSGPVLPGRKHRGRSRRVPESPRTREGGRENQPRCAPGTSFIGLMVMGRWAHLLRLSQIASRSTTVAARTVDDPLAYRR
jgi:hypothetical protein